MYNMLLIHTQMCSCTCMHTHKHTLTSGFVDISKDRFDCCGNQNHNDTIDRYCTHTDTHTHSSCRSCSRLRSSNAAPLCSHLPLFLTRPSLTHFISFTHDTHTHANTHTHSTHTGCQRQKSSTRVCPSGEP